MNYKIPYACISHIGLCRHTNQDNFICEGKYREEKEEPVIRSGDALPEGLPADPSDESCVVAGCLTSDSPAILGVFDGMGGEECGEEAALLASREAAGTLIDGDSEEILLSFCRRANAQICRFADQNGILTMGATAALLAFDPEGVALCNIGDSKIFCCSDHSMKQLSLDHISVAPYGVKPPLSQNLGIPPTEILIEPYTASRDYKSGDIFLICSDGLTDMVSREEIERTLEAIPVLAKDERLTLEQILNGAARHLLDLALINGGKDNITIILCEILPQIANSNI